MKPPRQVAGEGQDRGQGVLDLVGEAGGQGAEGRQALRAPEVRLQLPLGGEVPQGRHDPHHPALAPANERRGHLQGHRPAPVGDERRHRHRRAPGGQALLEEAGEVAQVAEGLARRAAPHGLQGAARQRLGRGVQSDDAPLQVQGDDARGERGEEVVGVALEIRQLLEPPGQLAVGRLQGLALDPELGHHVVEGPGELADLVGGGRLHPEPEVPPRDGGSRFGQPPDGARDPPGHEPGPEPAQGERRHPQRGQLLPGRRDLRLHPPAGEPDPHRPPPLTLDQHREGEVQVRLAGDRRLLDQEARGGGCPAGGRIGGRSPDPPRLQAVGGHPPLGVQDHGVGDVGVLGEARDVLLEDRVVVEEERTGRDRSQVPGQDRPPPLHLGHDRRPLTPLDDEAEADHQGRDHQDRPEEEPGLERHEGAGDRAHGSGPRGPPGRSSRLGRGLGRPLTAGGAGARARPSAAGGTGRRGRSPRPPGRRAGRAARSSGARRG